MNINPSHRSTSAGAHVEIEPSASPESPSAERPFAKIDRLRIGPQNLSGLEGLRHRHCSFVGIQPAFLASEVQVERIARRTILPPQPKPYQGFNRVCRSLRHIATAIQYGMLDHIGLDPIEVQASVIAGRLYVSSNFHSHSIQVALRHALTAPLPNQAAWPENRNNKQQVGAARFERHLKLLRRDFLDGDVMFFALLRKVEIEISKGIGLPSGSNLARDEVLSQAHAALRTLRDVIEKAVCNTLTSDELVVCHPRQDKLLLQALPPQVTQTMHAEQSIANALAITQEEVYRTAISHLDLAPGNHVVVPMAGKFIPCATCHEVESQARRDKGLFDPTKGRFLLHRASLRVGMTFWNEVQHIAADVLDEQKSVATAKAIEIRDRFIDAPERLQCHDREMVIAYSFDTDSEASSCEK